MQRQTWKTSGATRETVGPGAATAAERAARFQALYEAIYKDVFYFILRRVGSIDGEARAEDIANETFLAIWRRLDEVPQDLDSARAYIFTVARNCLLK